MHRGMVASREAASELIHDGKVFVNGSVASKSSRQVKAEDQLFLSEKPKYVSRGGLKLEGALGRFNLSVEGIRALDAGSSTGGFSDCLLQRGVEKVYAVDVGTNQLHEKIRGDLRVVSLEKTNIRNFRDPEQSGFDLVVADLSFTSVRTLASALIDLTKPGGNLIILVKPQFEVGHRDVSKGRGIIKDPSLWSESLLSVGAEFERLGVHFRDLCVSPIRGTQGNVEFFYYFHKGESYEALELSKAVEAEISLFLDA